MPRRNKKWRSEYQQQWYLDHREQQIEVMRKRRKEIRDIVFTAYGGYKCTCCGETNPSFLSLDHIDGGGNEHRRSVNRKSGIGFQYWLIKNGFPPGFQVLCYNWNLGRAFAGGGICPHKLSTDGVGTLHQSHYYHQKEITMAKMKANPLGHLEMELIHDQSTISGGSMSGDDVIRDQAPVLTGLAAQDTFKADASKPSSRADIEKRRGYFDSGADLKGASMAKEFGSADTQSKEFTDDKSA